MPQHIVKCPSCKSHFSATCENDFTGNVLCTECGCSAPFQECEVLMLCPSCKSKLLLPAKYMTAEGMQCPNCSHPLTYTTADSKAILEDSEKTAVAVAPPPQRHRQLLEDGQFIDNYRIDKLIGAGGMAEVYLATHVLLNRRCALKVMKSDIYSKDPALVKRFIREAQLMQRIDHPNIVKIYDAGNDKKTGLLFLAMEYVEGEDLSSYSKKHSIEENQLTHVLTEVTQALVEMHKQGIVHRDIKPANIMLCNDGSIKLMDLGIAKATQPEDGSKEYTLTIDQAVLGTPAYASPEQCRSAHTADIRSDIYSLGASLYHLAAGHPPFHGTTAIEILLKVIEEEPEPLKNIRPDLSPFFIALIQKMMAKLPQMRQQTPEELLQEIMQGTPLFKNKRNLRGALPFVAGLLVIAAVFTVYAIVHKENKSPTSNVVQPEETAQAALQGTKEMKVISFSSEKEIFESLNLVCVGKGTFKMGSKDGEEDDVEHDVTISKDFWIGKYEVTQAEWKQVMGDNPSEFKGDDLPVEGVSWEEAMEFCWKLNKKTDGKRPEGYRFSLPTEAQWEYAARGGSKSSGYEYSGSNTCDDVAWFDDNSRDKTHEVGLKNANELGLHDMSGNVWEWCLDWHGKYPSGSVMDPSGPSSGLFRVNRGGSWNFGAEDCLAANRGMDGPLNGRNFLGFRLALVPVQ